MKHRGPLARGVRGTSGRIIIVNENGMIVRRLQDSESILPIAQGSCKDFPHFLFTDLSCRIIHNASLFPGFLS